MRKVESPKPKAVAERHATRQTLATIAALLVALTIGAYAQAPAGAKQDPKAKPPATKATKNAKPTPTPPVAPIVVPDPGYTIGPEDVLGIQFWRDTDMSGDVTVRPDGMITLPLVRDVKAVGLTPTELADTIQTAARAFVTDASVTVVVRQMNSRKAFITGEVVKPGGYPLTSTMTVMQLIAMAGGLTEWAQPKSISIIRNVNGTSKTFFLDYRNVAKGKKPEQNLVLKPGDTIIVPEK